jgi:2-dehydropantoate 2-reductase
MGCLLAGLLAEAGQQVALLDHRPSRAARIARDGLTLEGKGGARRVPLRAVASVQGLPGPPEVVFLCVKAGATEAAVAPLRDLAGATVAVVQNGLDRARRVGELLGAPGRVVGVLTTHGATLRGEGHVVHAGRGRTLVGALEPEEGARAARVAEILAKTEFGAQAVQDLEREVWAKLVVNAAINALTGLLGVENGALLESAAATGLADLAAAEVAALAQARGVAGDWSAGAVQAAWRAVARATAANQSSTLQDLLRGRKTEVCAINGAVARAAHEAGLSACVNDTLARLVEAREQLSPPGDGGGATPTS